MKGRYILTLSDQRLGVRRRVWDGEAPLLLNRMEGLWLEKRDKGFYIRNLFANKSSEFFVPVFESKKVSMGRKGSLILRKVVAPSSLASTSIHYIPHVKPNTDEVEKSFLRNLKNVSLFFGLVVFLLQFYPKERTENEVIPPQVAKVLLRPAFKDRVASKGDGGEKSVKRVAGKVNSATRNLLSKKTLNRLKAISQLSTTASASARSKVFSGEKAIRGGLVEGFDVSSLANLKLGGGEKGGYGKGVGLHGQGDADYLDIPESGAAIEKGLTREEIGRVIHQHISEVRYCYESSILKEPSLSGKLIVDFVIAASGFSKTVEIKESTVGKNDLGRCIISRLRKWRFPKPKGGVDVAVSYPFVFKKIDR